MHYNYVDFINLSIKVRENLTELTLDCREINLLQEGNLKLLCSKIKNCSSLKKCTLIYMHVHEGFICNSDEFKNIRFMSNGNGRRYIDMNNHRLLTSFNMAFLVVLTICFIYYLRNLKPEFHFNYYHPGTINIFLAAQSLVLLLLFNSKELLNNMIATKRLDEIRQRRLELLSQAFVECDLAPDQPKVASYRDPGQGFISLHEESYFLDIPIAELCEAIKDGLGEKIFIMPELDPWSTGAAGLTSTATSLNSFHVHNTTTNYYSLTESTYQLREDSPKKLRMSI